MKTLSGGELQKVAITLCLMNDADIYALDEPSAFIDVDDRIVLARAIQKFVKTNNKSAIIIDHDIQLIDILSDSLLLFTGQNGVKGHASAPTNKLLSMNEFLKSLEITYRRDIESGRPRVNKSNSRLDKEQKSNNQRSNQTKKSIQQCTQPSKQQCPVDLNVNGSDCGQLMSCLQGRAPLPYMAFHRPH